MKSIRDLYKIGKGPSSSHTMGPERAARIFKQEHPDAERYEVTLYGSLALTGVGHGTDRVLSEVLSPTPTEIIFSDKDPDDLKHPNTLDFAAYKGEEKIASMRVESIAAEGRESFAEGCGRIGTTMPTTVEALAKFCAATLHSGVKYVNGQKPVTCLAEVSGGGGSYLEEAIARGADCLVTGEAAHHIALLAKQKGIGLVVAGHWGTEHAIADVLAVQLEKQFPALTVAHAEADADPYSYLL